MSTAGSPARSSTTTRVPSALKRSTIAAPMPAAPPVTRAVLPFNPRIVASAASVRAVVRVQSRPMKILLAVDGSKEALNAVAFVAGQAAEWRQKPQVELVTVHRPIPKLPGMSAAVGKAQIERYYQEEGAAALAEAKKRL